MSAALDAQGLALAARATALAARQSLAVYNRPGLAAWHAALANRAAAPAKVLWVGDSIVEGVDAASYGTRWVDRALARLRLDHPTAGVTGGFGYLPAIFGGGTANQKTQGQPYASLTGAALTVDTSFGLGGRCSKYDANGDGATYNLTCSSFQVHWIRGSGLGTLDILVDGVGVASFSTAGALAPQVWTSAALTPGSHAITLRRSSASGSVYVAGLIGFNGDEAAGVQGHEAGHFGWTSGQYAAAQSYTWTAVGQVAPQLAVIALGTNDYGAQTSLATFRANLASIVTLLRTASPGLSIALVAYARRGDVAAQPIAWNQYVATLYDLADTDTGGLNGASGIAVIDLSTRLPNAATSGTVDPFGIGAGDRVHYAVKGHAAIGEMVGRALAL